MVIFLEDYLPNDSQFLYEIINYNLQQGVLSIINCKSFEEIPMDFFNKSLGKIYKENNNRKFECIRKIHYINLDDDNKEKIATVIKNASQDAVEVSCKLVQTEVFDVHKEVERLLYENRILKETIGILAK